MEAIDDDHSMLLSAHDGGKDVKTVHLPRKKVCKFFFFFLLVLCFDSRETPTTTDATNEAVSPLAMLFKGMTRSPN